MEEGPQAFVILIVLAVVFHVLQRRWPAHAQRRTLRDTLTDLAYLLFNPLVTRTISKAALAVVAGLAAAWLTGARGRDEILHAFSDASWVGSLPVAVQASLLLVVSDFLGYWIHRGLHRYAWRTHAVHHSAERLDWLSAVRLHPVNDLLATLLRVVPLFLVGFRFELVAGFVPLFGLYGLLLHANVRWRFGPLRYVIASPAFHRWHHAADEAGRDKNFAGLLPLWDLIFGTFHLPVEPPRACGIDDAVPNSLWGQLRYGFSGVPGNEQPETTQA